MPFALIIVLFLAAGIGAPVALHTQMHGFNVHQLAIAFFLWLNVMICLWEIALGLRIGVIREQYLGLAERFAERPMARVAELFTSRVPLGQILAPTTWGQIWSTYSLFDDSYSDDKSYGFWIDVGNGFSTVIPSLLFLYGMTYDVLDARALGIIGVIINWQMFYGTVIYFSQFLYHRRYRGHSARDMALFVGLSNGMWFVFPVWGMVASVMMIYSGDFSLLR